MNAEKDYDRAGHFAKGVSQTLIDLIEAIEDYMAHDAKYRNIRAFNNWLKAHDGEGKQYVVIGDCTRELYRRLNMCEIGCYQGEGVIFMRPEDLQKAKELNKQILLERHNYIQTVELDKMITAFRHSGQSHMDTFIIEGLTSYEREVLINKCSNLKSGFTVGIDKGRIGVHERDVFDETDGSRDFCAAFLKATVSLYGPNHGQKVKELEHDIKYRNELTKLFNEDTERESKFFVDKGEPNKFIVGAASDGRYIELSAKGFEYYEVHAGKSISVTQVKKDDPSYAVELQRCSDKMSDKQLMSEEEKINHFAHPERTSQKRAARNYVERERAKFEDALTDKINDMIEERAQQNASFSSLTPGQKFDFYTREAQQILQAIARDDVLPEYKKEDFEAIKKMARYTDETQKTRDGKSVLSQALVKTGYEMSSAEKGFDLTAYDRAAHNMRSFKTRTISPIGKEKDQIERGREDKHGEPKRDK